MPDIESLLKEKRVFKPTPEFTRKANWNKKTINEYRKLGARELLMFHVSLLSRGSNLWPIARRILVEVLDRLDDPLGRATVGTKSEFL